MVPQADAAVPCAADPSRQGADAIDRPRTIFTPVARVVFTKNLQRHVTCPPVTVNASTVGEALEGAFATIDRLRGYVVDERGALRKHINVFVDGEQILDRVHLSDPVGPDSAVHVMQALSGG
jgi:molybdopterin synthase sulfur carrier subunit